MSFYSDDDYESDDGLTPEMRELEGLGGNPLLYSAYSEHFGFRSFQLGYCDKTSKTFNVISFLRAVLHQGKGYESARIRQQVLSKAYAALDVNDLISRSLAKFPLYRGKRVHYYAEDYVPMSCSTRKDVVNRCADKIIDYHRLLTVSIGGCSQKISWEGQYLLRVKYGSLLLRMHTFVPHLSSDVISIIKRKKLNQKAKNQLEKNLHDYQLSRQVVMVTNLSSIKKIYVYDLNKSEMKKGEAFLVIEVGETPTFCHKYTTTNIQKLNKWKKCSDPFQGKPTLKTPYHVILGSADCLDLVQLVQGMIAEYPPLRLVYVQSQEAGLKHGWKSSLEGNAPSAGCEEPRRAPTYADGQRVIPSVKLVQSKLVTQLMMAFLGGYQFDNDPEADDEIGDLIGWKAAGDGEQNNNDDGISVDDKANADLAAECSDDESEQDSSDEGGGDATHEQDILLTPSTTQLRKVILDSLVKHDLLTRRKADKILVKPKNVEGPEHLRKSAINNYLGGLKFQACFVDYLNFTCTDIQDLEFLLNQSIEGMVDDCTDLEEFGIDDGDVTLTTVCDLVRFGPHDDIDEHYYYAFCREEILHSVHDSHCELCHFCNDWHYWHCFNCGRCSYGESIPKCEHCRINNNHGNSDQPPMKTDFKSCVIRGSKLYSIYQVSLNCMQNIVDFSE